MSELSRPVGIYGTGKKNIPGVILRAQAMHDNILLNVATFVSPTISMVVFLALITALAAAQQNALSTKAKGTATFRNTKRDAVWTAMDVLRGYIQSIADTMSAENASSVLQMGGLLVAATAARAKAILAATLTTTGGLVHLEANASLLKGKAARGRKAQFNWEWSSDGKTWNSVASTPYARTDVTGLTPMSTYSFRVSVTVGKVTGAWSQPVSILVLH
jgi:hypothetical protein